VTYEWLDGGSFLLQTVDLRQDGEPIRGVEVIGHASPDRPCHETVRLAATTLAHAATTFD
jgi:hypothetical protein